MPCDPDVVNQDALDGVLVHKQGTHPEVYFPEHCRIYIRVPRRRSDEESPLSETAEYGCELPSRRGVCRLAVPLALAELGIARGISANFARHLPAGSKPHIMRPTRD